MNKAKRKQARKRRQHQLRAPILNKRVDPFTAFVMCVAAGVNPETYWMTKQYFPNRKDGKYCKLVRAKLKEPT